MDAPQQKSDGFVSGFFTGMVVAVLACVLIVMAAATGVTF